MPSRVTCSPPPRRTTCRSPQARWRTPSSHSPLPLGGHPMRTAVAPRGVPPFGGFSPIFLGLEIRRMLRNRRTIVFPLVVPPVFYLLFGGLSDANRIQPDGVGNVSAYIMISFAVYGSMIANTSAGASVAVERAWGCPGNCGSPAAPGRVLRHK